MKYLLLCSLIAFSIISNEPIKDYDKYCAEFPQVVPPSENCATHETQRLGMSMMGWGLAIIAAIAIVAGTVEQSTGN